MKSRTKVVSILFVTMFHASILHRSQKPPTQPQRVPITSPAACARCAFCAKGHFLSQDPLHWQNHGFEVRLTRISGISVNTKQNKLTTYTALAPLVYHEHLHVPFQNRIPLPMSDSQSRWTFSAQLPLTVQINFLSTMHRNARCPLERR